MCACMDCEWYACVSYHDSDMHSKTACLNVKQECSRDCWFEITMRFIRTYIRMYMCVYSVCIRTYVHTVPMI